jgi:hypothetical protein
MPGQLRGRFPASQSVAASAVAHRLLCRGAGMCNDL